MNEIVKPVGVWIGQNVGWSVLIVIFIFSLFFEFSKIKLSPITALFSWIGNRLNGGLNTAIQEMKENTDEQFAELKQDYDEKFHQLEDNFTQSLEDIKVQTAIKDEELKRNLQMIEEQQDRQAASRIKAHVLNFANSLMNKERHSKEDFENLIKENKEYEALVEKHKWENDVYKEDYKFFLEEYHRCQRENDFLRQ